MSNLISRDRLNSCNKSAVAKVCVKAFDAVQGETYTPEQQLLGLCAAFILMAEACQFNTNDAYAAVTKLMRDSLHSSGRDHRFDAMRFHIENELKGGR